MASVWGVGGWKACIVGYFSRRGSGRGESPRRWPDDVAGRGTANVCVDGDRRSDSCGIGSGFAGEVNGVFEVEVCLNHSSGGDLVGPPCDILDRKSVNW